MDRHLPGAVGYLLAAVCGGLGGLMLLWRPGPNLWMGVRLPWTFADRRIWDKSWRLAALFLMGMAVGALFSWKIFVISLVHLLVLGILYPLYLYRRKYGTLRYWKDLGRKEYRPVARCRSCGHLQKLADSSALDAARCEACGSALAAGVHEPRTHP
jgi:hypothetical protein